MTMPQYLEMANDNILVMVQIETKEAVEKVQEIAQVDGVGKSTVLPIRRFSTHLIITVRCTIHRTL